MDTITLDIEYACPNCAAKIDVSTVDILSTMACPSCKATLTGDPALSERLSVMHFLTDVEE